MDEDDQIPVVEIYRGVGIEDQQPPERVELVKCAIDHVHRMSGADELVDYADDARHPPEARLLAGISLEKLRASTAGRGSRRWRDPWRYCALLDADGGVERERPLDDLE